MLEDKLYKWISGEVSSDAWWSVRQKALGGGISAFLYKCKYFHISKINSAFIPLTTKFAGKPILPHGIWGIFISNGAEIGENVVIMHQVTIGSNTLKDSKLLGAPKIGDNVFIGAGAKIIGGISIGNNVRVGANCVVTTDIPSNSTVVLEKPRIIVHSKERNNDFVSWSQLQKKKGVNSPNNLCQRK